MLCVIIILYLGGKDGTGSRGRVAALKKKEKSCRLERGQESMHGRNEEQRRLKGAERMEKERREGWGKEQRGLREPEPPRGVKERVAEDWKESLERLGLWVMNVFD